MGGTGQWVTIPEGGSYSRGTFDLGNNTSYQLVSNRFDISQQYAADSLAVTYTYITELSEIIQSLALPDTASIDITVPDIPYFDYTKRPSVGSLDLEISDVENTSKKPEYLTVPDVPDFEKPAKTFSVPSYTAIDVPEWIEIAPPEGIGTLYELDVPAAPSITLPDPPTLQEITLPVPPAEEVVYFDGEKPEVILTEPKAFNYTEPAYSSDIWSDLLGKVLDDIRNGGTGLDVQVEEEIYERALERQRVENERLYLEAETYYSSRGYTLPPGALAGQIAEIQQQILRQRTEINSQIMIDQAKLAQDNTHFMVQKGFELESLLRQFFNEQSNRVLEAAKTAAASSIDVFNALVAKYNLELSAYQTEASVYESRLKASLYRIERYKAMVESAKVSQETQALLIDIYDKQISALKTEADLYATRIEGVKALSDVNLGIIEQFRSRVQAYVSQQEAQKIRFDAYDSAMRGEQIKAETFTAQVNAYTAEVNAERAVIEAATTQQNAIIQQNLQEIERYKSELEAYRIEVDSAMKVITAKVQGFEAEVSAYNAETSAEGSYYDTLGKQISAKIQEASFNLQKAVSEVEAVLRGYTSLKELEIKGTESIMNVGAQLASSAMNAVNASASYGYNSSEGRSESWSHGEDLSETHSYNETTTG